MGRSLHMEQTKLLKLLSELDELYGLTADERKKVHDFEWKEEPDYSFLGEIELIADLLSAYAIKYQKKNHELENLQLNSLTLLTLKKAIHWATVNKEIYPHIFTYTKTLESLKIELTTLN